MVNFFLSLKRSPGLGFTAAVFLLFFAIYFIIIISRYTL